MELIAGRKEEQSIIDQCLANEKAEFLDVFCTTKP
jgi:hypothetical protein